MKEDLKLEERSFQIISFSGEARSIAIEAIRTAKESKKFAEARKMLKESEQMIINAEKQHMDLVVNEAKGEIITPTILLLHAEDQLLSTQTLIQLAHEIVDIHEMMQGLRGGKNG